MNATAGPRRISIPTSHDAAMIPYAPYASLDAPWQRRLIERFETRHARPPILDHPETFVDKLAFRVLLDHDPLYPAYANKLFAPYFARAKVGDAVSFAERYGVFSTLTREAFAALPDRFVLKGSHASGLNALVEDKASADIDGIIAQFNDMVRSMVNARGRNDPNAAIIAEEWLTDGTGSVPTDYKFHCFHALGREPQWLLYVLRDRFGDPTISMYDSDLVPVPFQYGTRDVEPVPLNPPTGFEQMIDTALRLSAGFDYVRVDLMLIDARPCLGEITPFPEGGNTQIDHMGNIQMGELWRLRPNHLARGSSEATGGMTGAPVRANL